MPAWYFRAVAAENFVAVGVGDGAPGRAGAGLSGDAAISSDCTFIICTLAGDACLHRRIAAARGPNSVLDFERAAGGLAGKDQLQPLFVAAAVCLRDSWQAVVFRVVCVGAGERFVLSSGAADAAAAGEKSGAEDGVGAGCVKNKEAS